MNDVILALDGSKNHKINYSDTGTKYTHEKDYDILKEQGLIGKNLFQSKNDYGDAAIIYGLFLAPTFKHCLVFNGDDLIQQKKLLKDAIDKFPK